MDNLDYDVELLINISNFSSLLVGAVDLTTLLRVGIAHITNHKYVKLRLNYFKISIFQTTKNNIMNIITFLKEGIPLKKIHVIHENTEWTRHLTNRLEELDLPYEEWHLDKGNVDISSVPPQGVFYNRMSASSHTRNHRFAPEFTGAVLVWLERHNRKVFNGSRALQLEVSKVAQYMALNAEGIRTPKTIAAVGKDHIIEAATQFEGRLFITKHNRAGKGLGVQLFQSVASLQGYVESAAFEEPVDGITLIQEYIQSPEPYITRCEFVDGKSTLKSTSRFMKIWMLSRKRCEI